MKFDNRLIQELPGDPEEENRTRQVYGACWSAVQPTPVSAPKILAYSREMLKELELSEDELSSQLWIEALSGNGLIDGMTPYALCYGGHQFGNWAGQLGDGRAINLGETINAQGKRWVLQLKGAGPTPYSRRADGRAVLRSSIREFICSEAMHHLGVPTTRALSLVLTGDQVLRDMFYDGRAAFEPGAVVCRVSPSFLRFGNIEILASRGEDELLKKLIAFALDRDFPDIKSTGDQAITALFCEVSRQTALLVSHWMRVGFVHGVMNTDNMSLLGLTIDYGPYGWIDDYDPNWTPNTTDLPGKRYCFGHQPRVAQWNLLRLADALAPVMEDSNGLKEGFEIFVDTYEKHSLETTYRKFGLPGKDTEDERLLAQGYFLLEQSEVDMTLFFRSLSRLEPNAVQDDLGDIFYDAEKKKAHEMSWNDWLKQFQARIEQIGEDPVRRKADMEKVNPLYVPRNYLLQEAIESAEAGDSSRVHELLELFRDPYSEKAGKEHFSRKRPDWARTKPGCSMLSCSS